MANNSSAELLTNLFKRFQRRAAATTGVKMSALSMRRVSEDLLALKPPAREQAGAADDAVDGVARKRKPDVNALGRWTNPGGRTNWFIPIARVLDVARKLSATSEESDALMLARLTEIAQVDPEHDALVCGAWVAQRVRAQMQLDPEEQALLDAFRKSRATSPYAMLTPEALSRVSSLFEQIARTHMEELALEQQAGVEEDLSPEGEKLLRERKASVIAQLRAARAVAPASHRALSAEVLARRFLRSLRK